MANLTWYSTEKADRTFATKVELEALRKASEGIRVDTSTLATKEEVTRGDDALSSRLNSVKTTADAALPKAEAAATYATKEEALATERKLGERVDSATTSAATKAELAKYATTTSVAETYATKESLGAYLKSEDAASTYATKAELSQAQAGGHVDLSSYLTRVEAQSTYVSNENLYRELEQKAGLAAVSAVDSRVDAMAKTITPFKPGERYYSPVTYFWPDYYEDGKPGKTSKWAQILKFAGSLGIVILNRNSGNWDEFNVDFQKQAQLALAAGAKRAVFYVKTQYLAATLPAGDPGRANVPDVDKYTEAYILSQIDKAKTQYGDVCQGVFLDEAINGWGAQAGRIPAYKSLIDKIRAKYGKEFLIVINSGSNISEEMCKLDFDVCMMFEKDAAAFLVEDPGTPILPDHMKAYPSTRWWAVVHGVTSENYKSVFDKADKLGIAHLYITDGQLREDPQQGGQWAPVGNPYANPPSQHILDLTVPWLKGYLPLKLEVEELRSRPKVLSLGKREQVPAGTPAGTIIVRKDA